MRSYQGERDLVQQFLSNCVKGRTGFWWLQFSKDLGSLIWYTNNGHQIANNDGHWPIREEERIAVVTLKT